MRLIRLAVLLGMATVLVAWGLVRCAIFDDKMEEAKRYEVFGRRVETLIGKYRPKEQERVYRARRQTVTVQPGAARPSGPAIAVKEVC